MSEQNNNAAAKHLNNQSDSQLGGVHSSPNSNPNSNPNSSPNISPNSSPNSSQVGLPSNSPAETSTTGNSAQEIIERLEKRYSETMNQLTENKKQLSEIQDKVLNSQETAFVAFQNLMLSKEQYYIAIIKEQGNQISQLKSAKLD